MTEFLKPIVEFYDYLCSDVGKKYVDIVCRINVVMLLLLTVVLSHASYIYRLYVSYDGGDAYPHVQHTDYRKQAYELTSYGNISQP